MVRRVYTGAGNLKVSKPGIDVLTAGPGQLQFSSDWSQLGLYLAAELDCDWDETGFRTYPFGKTFPSPPLVHFQRVMNGGEFRELSCACSFYWQVNGNTEQDFHGVYAEATTTGLRIRSQRANDWQPFRLRYTVLDYNV